MKEGDKLYIVTRADLTPGQQAVQGMHAMRQFIEEHRDIDAEWFKVSNYIAFLSVADDEELGTLYADALEHGVAFSTFHEPDMDNDLTALCLEPGNVSAKLCKRMKLALG